MLNVVYVLPYYNCSPLTAGLTFCRLTGPTENMHRNSSSSYISPLQQTAFWQCSQTTQNPLDLLDLRRDFKRYLWLCQPQFPINACMLPAPVCRSLPAAPGPAKCSLMPAASQISSTLPTSMRLNRHFSTERSLTGLSPPAFCPAHSVLQPLWAQDLWSCSFTDPSCLVSLCVIFHQSLRRNFVFYCYMEFGCRPTTPAASERQMQADRGIK